MTDEEFIDKMIRISQKYRDGVDLSLLRYYQIKVEIEMERMEALNRWIKYGQD